MKRVSLPFWNKYFSPKEQVILAIFLFVGLVIRIVNAIKIPLWRDEVYIFYVAHSNSVWKLITQDHWDTAHPPLYSLFLHFWQLISVQPFWLRLPSIITSFFILYLIPILAVKISTRLKTFPFILLFLFSFSHTQISLDMVVRPYPFATFFIIISLIQLLSMIENKQQNIRFVLLFCGTNLLALFTDYGSIWLFVTYLFFFPFYFFSQKKSKSQVYYVLKSLILLAILSLCILPYLLGNLQQSLYLERALEPLKSQTQNMRENSIMYVLVRQKEKKIYFYNERYREIGHKTISTDPFPHNKIYVGYSISSLSSLFVNEFSYCKVDTQVDVGYWSHNCKFQALNTTLNKSTLKKMSRLMPTYLFGKKLFLSNIRFRWEIPVYSQTISINNEDVIFKVSMSSFHLNDSSGINIFGKLPENGKQSEENVRKIAIYISEFHYRVYYQDGPVSQSQDLFGDSGILEKLSSSIDFFTGIPSESNFKFKFILTMLLLITSQVVLIREFISSKRIIYLLISTIFIIPIALSFFVSYFYIPIFLGRNLFICSIAYIVGLSFLVSLLLKKNVISTFFGSMIIIFYLCVFIRYFPYIHYVDPPYEINSVVTLLQKYKNTNDKIIIFVDNQHYYLPLLDYEMLILNKKIKSKIRFIPLPEFDQIEKEKLSDLTNEKSKIFFLQFRNGHEPLGVRLTQLAKILHCKPNVYQLNHVYFAQCK